MQNKRVPKTWVLLFSMAKHGGGTAHQLATRLGWTTKRTSRAIWQSGGNLVQRKPTGIYDERKEPYRYDLTDEALEWVRARRLEMLDCLELTMHDDGTLTPTEPTP